MLSYQTHQTRYEDNGIYTTNVEGIIRRNKQKSVNLDILSTASKIFGLPIETYYFSCNLDHVLYNERNLPYQKKEKFADDFADKYYQREVEFLDFIINQHLLLSKEYRKSWEEIKKDLNSLHRFTNVYSFFINNKDYLNETVKKKIDDQDKG